MINKKVALLSGGRGQDASLLSRLLLKEDWKVVAFERHTQNPNYENIAEIMNHPNYILEKADVTDAGSVFRVVDKYKPEHFYHLAAASFVHSSWNEPMSVLNTNSGGTLNCLESVRINSPQTKFLFASTSEVVGNSKDIIQNEDTILTPHSPYSAAKAFGEHIIHVYRFSHKLFCCFTRCYNHESKFRGRNFVTRKITDWIGKNWNIVDKNMDALLGNNSFINTEEAFERALNKGIINKLDLGNLNSSRDWLAAEDCVRAMFMVLNQDKPSDYVVASGKMHSIDDFLRIAFSKIGISNYIQFIGQDEKNLRPSDVITLLGDYSKIKKALGWEPTISFDLMIKQMIDHDLELYSGKS